MKKIMKNMIVYGILLTILIIWCKYFLNNKNLEFTNIAYITITIIISLLFIIGIIQIICKMRSIILKIFFIMTFMVFIGLMVELVYFYYDVFIPKEAVIKKYNERLVTHTYLDTVKYYKHINNIVRGKNMEYYEEIQEKV